MTRGDSREPATRSIPEPGADRWVPRPDISDALAEVVRKAREAGGGAHLGAAAVAPEPGRRPRRRQLDPIGPDEALVITDPVPAVRSPRPPAVAPSRSVGLRRLLVGVALVALVAIILGAANLAIVLTRHQPPPPRAAASTSLPVISQPATTVPPPPASSTTTTTAPQTTTTAPPASAGAGAPRLSSVTPGKGGAGRVVTVHGSNLYSPTTGVVVAKVDGMPAPTQCPTQDTCQVTIPALHSRPTTILVSITTQSGTSNPLTFRYT